MKNTIILLSLFITSLTANAQFDLTLPDGNPKELSEKEIRAVLKNVPDIQKGLKGSKKAKAYFLEDNTRKRFGAIIGIELYQKGEMAYYLEITLSEEDKAHVRAKEAGQLTTDQWGYYYSTKKRDNNLKRAINMISKGYEINPSI